MSLSPIILGNSGSPLSSKSNSMPSPGLKPGKTYLVSAWVAASGRSDGTGRVVGARDRLLLLHNLRQCSQRSSAEGVADLRFLGVKLTAIAFGVRWRRKKEKPPTYVRAASCVPSDRRRRSASGRHFNASLVMLRAVDTEQPDRRQGERRQPERRTVERRKNWDDRSRDRITELERQWRDQRERDEPKR